MIGIKDRCSRTAAHALTVDFGAARGDQRAAVLCYVGFRCLTDPRPNGRLRAGRSEEESRNRKNGKWQRLSRHNPYPAQVAFLQHRINLCTSPHTRLSRHAESDNNR